MNKTNNDIPDEIDAKEIDYLYLKPSKIIGAGRGLFSSIPIYENEVISLFKGEILSKAEASKRAKNKMDGYFINMLDGSIMDSKNVKCFAKYANDAEGNGKRIYRNNSKITLNENGNVCLVATKNIKAGEEIFCSYGKKYWINFNEN